MKRVLAVAFLSASMAFAASYLTVDLATNGSAATGGGIVSVVGGTGSAIFDATKNSTIVGTGVIDPFVRIQQKGTESGFNTDASGVLDDKAGTWTHSLLLGSLSAVSGPAGYAGSYYRFLLDINEDSGPSPLLSLDDLKLYTATTGNRTTLTGADLRYDFQSATACGTVTAPGDCSVHGGNSNNRILLDYSFNSGSGNGRDMFFYVPTSVFAGVPVTEKYLYLYSAFGGLGGSYASSAGFEEWAREAAPSAVPEPKHLLLLVAAAAAVFLVDFRRRRRSVA